MRKTNLLNTKIANAVSEIGHTQWLTIGDSGLPILDDGRKIDLSVVRGLPKFIDVLAATLSEMKVQKVYLASEITKENTDQLSNIKDLLDDDVEIVWITHDKLKEMSRSQNNIASIRTGEITAYSNIVLESNVDFVGEAIK
ncbi:MULTISPECIES: D-ribose pyranase [Leuconostoc]|uniref:D-ribose pyranase n=1 Tax=Leuconostoc TaxID=1243 RepID=UPI0002193C82|nr:MULTISPECIES: D-ribose pyranase [Leuconostoc]GMA66407.1 D-ribose pyranase [Leuconostoc gelidum subsp. gelidum]KAA8370240.1 D-ribose pyranase [Leuconostoc carnosum]MBZ5944183.1 D-ribose pyranase [Leuconostoc gasicomitatum]MBZ5951854.1 D-ribose pyranase [Leuconostoc gasicomitatum]MBZ5955145.1 D-ribose pyranase [Leuconostoc gasicomitatum]